MRLLYVAALLSIALSPSVQANDWARALFPITQHDFGSVAMAAKTEYRFEFENRSIQPIHVRSVRASCGCTTPIIETEHVPPGQRGSILARFNTHSHQGQRQATITVTFDKPQFAEVQLNVKGYVRRDIVFNPGELAFGQVQEGSSKTMKVTLDYAGRSDWKVLDIGSPDQFLSANLNETSRGNGRVRYEINVTLDGSAPLGPLQSEIVFKTNDRNFTQVPLRLNANILATISVSPPLMAMGDLKLGEPVEQVLILKGQKPFRILSIVSSDFDVRFEAGADAKALHTLPLKIVPKKSSGDVQGKILVKTDLPGSENLAVDASCTVLKE
jgi:hypothetical protein